MTDIDLSCWMKALPHDKRLVDTFIPGSHDSSSYPSCFQQGGFKNWLYGNAGGAITQNNMIKEQLELAGVRYLDLRCMLNGHEVFTHHGDAPGCSFEGILRDQIAAFLHENPSEFLILDIDVPGTNECDNYVLRILRESLDPSTFAVEHLNSIDGNYSDDGNFNPAVTWGQLRDKKRRVIITLSSGRYTIRSCNNNRLFGDWGGIRSTPTMVKLNGTLYMCLLDHDGAIYIAQCPGGDGIIWSAQGDEDCLFNEIPHVKRLFDDWSGVSSTPTMVEFNGTLYMCLLDHDGAIYIAKSNDGWSWSAKDEVVSHRLFDDWSGVSSTPTMVEFNGTLYMCLLDHDGAIYIAKSNDGWNWSTKDEVVSHRLFGEWGGVPTTPTLAVMGSYLYMCLLSNQGYDGGCAYITRSQDVTNWSETIKLFDGATGITQTPTMVLCAGTLWMCMLDSQGAIYLYYPTNSDCTSWQQKQRLFDPWHGTPSTPTMVLNTYGYLCMCRLGAPDWDSCGIYTSTVSIDNTGNVSTFDTNQSVLTKFNYLAPSLHNSPHDGVLWSPYDNFDQHNVTEILNYLSGYREHWDKKKLFVAQVVDTPGSSWVPGDHPSDLEAEHHDELNGWVKSNNSQSNVNIIMRDFVVDYPDTMKYIVSLNFPS